MKLHSFCATLAIATLAVLVPVLSLQSQSAATSKTQKKYQAKPPKTQPFGAKSALYTYPFNQTVKGDSLHSFTYCWSVTCSIHSTTLPFSFS